MVRRRIAGVIAAFVTPLSWGAAALAQGDPGAPPPPAAAQGDAAEADLAAADEPSPSRPPPDGQGAVWGVVTDAITKEPLLDAQISVVGTKRRAIADLDGRYRLELPPGGYQLRIWTEAYKARRVQGVWVTAGQVTQVDVELEPDQQAEEVIEVEFEPERASVAAQLLLRKNAPHVGDAIGAKEIAKTPDRNAAEAAKRIVGATVVDGKYVYVRGLGERYTNALLNGAPLPSPEPDRQAVPLDLFPSLVLSDITVVKTFTPDMPGDFAGGSVQINTRELPSELLFQASLSVAANTQSTFRDRLSYSGSSTDWLGIDGGARALPDELPDYRLIRLGPKPDGSTVKRHELTTYGRMLNTSMSTQRSFTPPNGSGSVVVGDTLKLGGEQKLGYIATLTYGRKFTPRADEIIGNFVPDERLEGGLRRTNDYAADGYRDQVSWGGFASATYNPDRDHKVMITGLHSRSSDDLTSEAAGFNEERGAEFRDTLLRFVTRSLTLGQLSGEHRFEALGSGTVDWEAWLSLATSDEPDTRENIYVKDSASGAWSWDRSTLSGSHVFIDLADTTYGGQLSYTHPLVRGDAPTRLKLGGLFSSRHREFSARRFRFKNLRVPDTTIFRLEPDELFSDENIGTALELEETTRGEDTITANIDLFAAYAMTDAHLTRWLRLLVGARVEAALQELRAFNKYSLDDDDAEIRADSDKVDLLPAAHVVVKTTPRSNLRLSVAKTLARPQLRELSPFLYQDGGYTGREVLGDASLERTSVVNGDLRFEFFPTAGEVAAISTFYKRFDAPVEEYVEPVGRGRLRYQNAKAGRVLGIELELRKSLGFIGPYLKDLTALVNVTLVRSQVELNPTTPTGLTILSSLTHPLQGQSPYVVNAGLDYHNESSGTSARLLYNVFGARLRTVGNELPDVYEQPRHQIDMTVAQRIGEHVELKLAGENLIDAPLRLTQGDENSDDNILSQYKVGTTVTLSAALTY